MSSMLKDMQYDARKKKILSTGQKYSLISIVSILIIIIAVVSGNWLIEKQQSEIKQIGNIFYGMLYHDVGDYEKKELLQKTMKNTLSPYHSVASLELAKVYTNEGNNGAALEIYASLSKDTNQIIQNIVKYNRAYLALNSTDDNIKKNHLNAIESNSKYMNLAIMEIKALQIMKSGKLKEAKKILEDIQGDIGISETQYNYVSLILDTLKDIR